MFMTRRNADVPFLFLIYMHFSKESSMLPSIQVPLFPLDFATSCNALWVLHPCVIISHREWSTVVVKESKEGRHAGEKGYDKHRTPRKEKKTITCMHVLFILFL